MCVCNTLCSLQVKPRTPKSSVLPALSAPSFPPRTASAAGLTSFRLHFPPPLVCSHHRSYHILLTPSVDVVATLQSFLRAQQRGVPDHSPRPGAGRPAGPARPEEEDPEEAEGRRQEKSGEEEEGEAAAPAPAALRSPRAGKRQLPCPDPGENSGDSSSLFGGSEARSPPSAL